MAKNSYISPAEKHLSQLKLRDLQKECILRGLKFKEVIEYDIPRLQSWFLTNYYNKEKKSRLVKFDERYEKKLIEEAGYDKLKDSWAFHPSLKMASEIEEPVDKPEKKVVEKKPKKKRENIEGFKVIAGTKKALTYQLANQGYHSFIVVERVQKEFPEAQEKSILIWYSKCQKEKEPETEKTAKMLIQKYQKKNMSSGKIIKLVLSKLKGIDKPTIKKYL